MDLDRANKFFRYSAYDKEFALKKSRAASKKEFYTVKINIKGKNGKTAQYSLKVSYQCSPKVKETEEFDQDGVYKPRYDPNPPTPYIHSISSSGEVRIRFNETMQPDASLIDSERLVLDERQLSSEMIKGNPNGGFRNYSMIHNGTITYDG